MKISKVHCLLVALVFVLLGVCIPSSAAETQQIVINNDQPEGRTQGLAADQVEKLETTEKFTFQVSLKRKDIYIYRV
jgi:hypothetical protein